MKIIFLALLFSFVFTEKIITSNFAEIFYSKGISEYIYHISDFTNQQLKAPYLLFKFYEYQKIEFKIKIDNLNQTIVNISKNIWITFPIVDINKKNFNVTFTIINESPQEYEMLFISLFNKEINIDLNLLLNLNLTITELNREPYPLIFNLDKIQSDAIIRINSKDIENIYNDDFLFCYCLVKDNKCDYKGINYTQIHLSKGENYKIKINSYNNNNTYNFKNLEILNLIQNIKFGKTEYIISKRNKYQYFILDIKDFDNIYLYIKNSFHIYISYFSEEDKLNYTNNIDAYQDKFSECIAYDIIKLVKKPNTDYLIIQLNNASNYFWLYEFFKRIIYIFNYEYKIEDNLNGKYIELEKGNHYIFTRENYYYRIKEKYLLLSDKENIEILSPIYKEEDIDAKLQYIFLPEKETYLIYIDSYDSNTKINFYNHNNDNSFLLLNNNDIDNYLIKHNFDSVFLRTLTNKYSKDFYYFYFFDINEGYYFYNKKYFGDMNIYEYNNILDIKTNITKFFENYDIDDYKIINNDLIKINGFKLLSTNISFNSLYDFYIQKVNDSEYINLSKDKSYNIVKLLNKNKIYYLNFSIDHIIKLDNKYLDANVRFIDKKGNHYILNKTHKVIRNLKGQNFTLYSDKIALIYFYKKILNTDYKVIEFDKSKKGKIMQFNITIKDGGITLGIAKDFGFKGYYPMVNSESLEYIKIRYGDDQTQTIFIDNYYDKLNENDLYEDEGEVYLIYFFRKIYDDINLLSPNIFNISQPTYFDSIPINNPNYNFQVIKPNNNARLMLNVINKKRIKYQFYTCKNEEINFTIYNNYNNIDIYTQSDFPYNKLIIDNQEISIYLETEETLVHKFEAKHEFLFIYSYSQKWDDYYDNYVDKNFILINQITNNNLEVIFNPKYLNDLIQYHIIITKKDKLNNIFTFSNPCYLANLLNNDNSIFKKSIFISSKDIISESIDIDSLYPSENIEFVISIIAYNVDVSNRVDFFSPIEFVIGKNNAIEFKMGESVIFNFKNKNYFKFYYNNNNKLNSTVYFYFDIENTFYIIYNKEGEKIQYFEFNKNAFELKLNETGIYYLYFYSTNDKLDATDYIFYTYIPGELIDTIDLSQNMYIKNIKMNLINNLKPCYYKVNNI